VRGGENVILRAIGTLVLNDYIDGKIELWSGSVQLNRRQSQEKAVM
jgi:hypothetical protein